MSKELTDAEYKKSTFDQVDITEFLPESIAEVYFLVEKEIGKFQNMADWKKVGVSEKDRVIRIKFWRMLDSCVTSGRSLNMRKLCSGLCTIKYFKEIFLDPDRASFIFTEPMDWKLNVLRLIDRYESRLEEIADLPLYDKNGNPKPSIASIQLRAYSILMDRYYGKAVEKIQQHNVNETRNSEKKVEQIVDLNTIEAELVEYEPVKKLPSSRESSDEVVSHDDKVITESVHDDVTD